MIIRARGAGNVELRTGWPDYTRPPRFFGQPSLSGERVTNEKAFGLPAFGAAVRLVAGTIAAACLDVFQGENADKQERDDSWQAMLFENPALEWSEFAWMWDIAASLEGYGNAVLQKMKARGRVTELIPIDMNFVSIYRDPQTREKVIEVMTADGPQRYTSNDMLHIRGGTLTSGIVGVSRVTQHRDPIGAQLAAQHFQGSYFRNHARPDVAVLFPQGVTKRQAEEWRDNINSLYGGADNFGKPIPIGGGAQITTIPISMVDAQFLESRQFDIEETGRMVDVHPLMLNHAGDRLQGDALRAAREHFLHIQMPPRLECITSALKADRDLFGRTDLYPEMSIDELRFVDPKTRAEVEHQRVQDGTLLVDEVRASRGLPPLPPIPDDPTQEPGKVPQITPVGGAPNMAHPAMEPSLDDPVGASRALPGQPDTFVINLPADHRELADALRELASAQRQAEPAQVHNHIAPDIRVAAPHVDNHVHVPEQPAPTVENNITVEERALPDPVAPVINVTTPAPVVNNNITVEETPVDATVTFNRNPNGSLKSADITEN